MSTYRPRHYAPESRSRAGRPVYAGTGIMKHARGKTKSYRGRHRETFWSGIGLGRSTWRPLTYTGPRLFGGWT